MRKKFKEYVRRIRLILKTEITTKKSKILATGILTVPLLKYSFTIINLHQAKIQKKFMGKQEWRMRTDADRRSLYSRS
jgi:hypothetical protein